MKLRLPILIVSAVVAAAKLFAGIEYIIAHERPDVWPMPGALISCPAEDGPSPFAKQLVRFSFDPSKIEGPKFGRITAVELVLFRPADENERKKREILQPADLPRPAPHFTAPDRHSIWMGGIEWREPLEMTPREISHDLSYDEFLRLAVLVRFESIEDGQPMRKRVVYLISEFKKQANQSPEGTPGKRPFLRQSLVPVVPHL